MTGETDAQAAKGAFWRERRARHPRLREALVADARVAARSRGERADFGSGLDATRQILRLAWVGDGFLALVLYRAKARLQALGVPVLPRLAHRLAMTLGQVCVGDPVLMAPGVYIVHGQTVIDGLTEIGPGCVIAPFTTIGLRLATGSARRWRPTWRSAPEPRCSARSAWARAPASAPTRWSSTMCRRAPPWWARGAASGPG